MKLIVRILNENLNMPHTKIVKHHSDSWSPGETEKTEYCI